MSVIRSIVIGRMLSALACILVSAQLALAGKDGWGWFLFAAILLGSITSSSETEELEEQ